MMKIYLTDLNLFQSEMKLYLSGYKDNSTATKVDMINMKMLVLQYVYIETLLFLAM